ncbi:hypothetical protein ACOSQ3_021791 [Xanthoceras sorbifolium]
MGSVISKAASSFGGVLGNAFTAPFKTIFSAACADVCAGPWDVICFVEHLCVFDLIKLLMILGLCYIILLFCYLLFKVGICQCIGRSLCKMYWAACKTYWYAVEDITCFLWHKIKNTKRRNRRRIRDVESGYSSSNSDGSYFPDKYHHLSSSRKRYRERKKWYGNNSTHHRRHHHHHHVKRGSIRLKNSRRLQLMKVKSPYRISKRRRFR